jgi:alginate O-acetyltransferase complex protein AlgI
MLFQSWVFLLFFLVFYVVFLATRRTRFANFWLLVASYVFYGWWEPTFPLILIYSTCFDYIAVARMEKGSRKKMWLVLSIANSIGLLSLFKYSGFAIENVNALLCFLAIPVSLPKPSILLPVGLSFYIFKSISYVVDCYRGDVKRESSFLNHAVFVSFFPILLAGPIERAGSLLAQIRKPSKISSRDIADGLSLFITGLFKKVALADQLALYVDKIYSSPGQYQSASLLLATFAFGWQLYFDFSGYSDMARGLARMMGFDIMLNFNNPYLATGLRDFWRRWHISLSSWFRDYLYIPLGGNKNGKFNTYRNIVITMAALGLWHGASWTFLLWGLFHAAGRCLTGGLEKSRFYVEKIPVFIKRLSVFVFVTLAWVLFRAATPQDAAVIFSRIFYTGLTDPKFPLIFAALILLVWIYQIIYESRGSWILKSAGIRIACMVSMIVYIIVFASPAAKTFIYFQF